MVKEKVIKFAIILFVVISILTLVIDVKANQTGSTFYLFTQALNLLVMGILTYYIYKVNKQVADISENTLKVTREQMIKSELKETDAMIGNIDEYLGYANIVKQSALPHLGYESMKSILSQIPSYQKDPIVNSSSISMIDPKLSSNVELNAEDQKKYDHIKNIFTNNIPSSIMARYKLDDLYDNMDNLKRFNREREFYRFKKNTELIRDVINILEELLDEYIFSQNEKNLILPELDCNIYGAQRIYLMGGQVEDFLINLKGLILEEQKDIIMQKTL
ncbi:hypothetical protein M4D71_23385 [Niallia taxi]|uniref:hypothetical protein n=1 Tax=Niallia taxi TaxID=2499688 RepID=UPI0021A30961|nr:hypothetical protein [Niallia taxi]MCT2347098.1 hypothetical protein [Niallia taxi]